MKISKCASCGAPLRPEQMQCDYCGSFVKYSKTFFTPEVHSGTTTNPSRTKKYLNLKNLQTYEKKCNDYLLTKCSSMTMYDINTGKPTLQFGNGELWIKEKL